MGFNAARDGMGGHPPIAVISSAEVHQSAIKACGILGLGREAISKVPSHGGAIDLDAFRRALSQVTGPAIVIANAAEVNTGAFDPIRSIAAASAAHPGGAWLHVDAAFGLYAALAPELRPLLDGIELADSVATDGHKWLNVPYDCGIVFVRDGGDLRNAFSATASYLSLSDAPAVWNAMDYVPEFSRRLRALSVWCALRSTGRDGMRKIVERAIANTRQFAAWIAQQPELELMAPAHLNIACFRVRGDASPEREDDLTARVVEEMQRGGIAYVTATRWNGRVAIRAAFDNWTTSAEDVNSLQRAVMLAVTRAATNQ